MTKILKLVYFMIFFVFLFFLVRVVNSGIPFLYFNFSKFLHYFSHNPFFIFINTPYFLLYITDYPYPCLVGKKTCQLNCPKPLIGVCSNNQCHCIAKFKLSSKLYIYSKPTIWYSHLTLLLLWLFSHFTLYYLNLLIFLNRPCGD